MQAERLTLTIDAESLRRQTDEITRRLLELEPGLAGRIADRLLSGIKSRHAVYMWPKNGPIPREAYLRLRYELRPEAFDPQGEILPEHSRADELAKAARKTAPNPQKAA